VACNSMQSDESQATFRRNTLPPFVLATCFTLFLFFFGLYSDPEDGGDMFLRNFC
jgi:hypothetical protein